MSTNQGNKKEQEQIYKNYEQEKITPGRVVGFNSGQIYIYGIYLRTIQNQQGTNIAEVYPESAHKSQELPSLLNKVSGLDKISEEDIPSSRNILITMRKEFKQLIGVLENRVNEQEKDLYGNLIKNGETSSKPEEEITPGQLVFYDSGNNSCYGIFLNQNSIFADNGAKTSIDDKFNLTPVNNIHDILYQGYSYGIGDEFKKHFWEMVQAVEKRMYRGKSFFAD